MILLQNLRKLQPVTNWQNDTVLPLNNACKINDKYEQLSLNSL